MQSITFVYITGNNIFTIGPGLHCGGCKVISLSSLCNGEGIVQCCPTLSAPGVIHPGCEQSSSALVTRKFIVSAGRLDDIWMTELTINLGSAYSSTQS